MEREELKKLALKLREETGESAFACRRVLARFDYDSDQAKAWFKLYYFDSHGFVRERNK